MKEKEFDIQLYTLAYNFLLQDSRISREILDSHLKPDQARVRPQSLNDLYKGILSSAQNVQRSPNVIGKAISGIKGNIDDLGEITFGFNPSKTLETFSKISPNSLFEKIRLHFSIKDKGGQNQIWIRYCKTIISAASFLSKFNTTDEFYEFIDRYEKERDIRPFVPMLLSFEIDGFGYALSSDFLKEIGYVNFGKPDTHIKDILISLGMLKDMDKSSLKADYFTQKIIERIAAHNQMTPYSVDKVLWLIGSGNFYKVAIETGGKKDEFISLTKSKLVKV